MARKCSLIVLGLMLLVFPSIAKADPAWIQGGTVQLGSSNAYMSFSGLPSFSVQATAGGFISRPCSFGCSAGDTISLSGSTGFITAGNIIGTITLDGTPHNIHFPSAVPPDVTVSGSMTFAAASVVIPTSSAPFVTVSTPFSVTAGSSFVIQDSNGLLRALSLVGGGNAFLTLRNTGGGRYSLDTFGYAFGTAQTPEPMTLALLGAGTLGLIAQRKLRRH